MSTVANKAAALLNIRLVFIKEEGMLTARSPIARSLQFYDFWNSNKKQRIYFYCVNHLGDVQLEQDFFVAQQQQRRKTLLKRNQPFLDPLYSRLVRNKGDSFVKIKDLQEIPKEFAFNLQDYDYYSPCGREMNLIRSLSLSPIVFHDLTVENKLIYAHSLQKSFEPRKLFLNENQVLCYKLTQHDDEYGVFHPHLLARLTIECISPHPQSNGQVFEWRGEQVLLPCS